MSLAPCTQSDKKRVSVDDISGPVISGPVGTQNQKMGGRQSTAVGESLHVYSGSQMSTIMSSHMSVVHTYLQHTHSAVS